MSGKRTHKVSVFLDDAEMFLLEQMAHSDDRDASGMVRVWMKRGMAAMMAAESATRQQNHLPLHARNGQRDEFIGTGFQDTQRDDL